MSGTDGTRDGSATGGTPGTGSTGSWNRPAWPSLSGDATSGPGAQASSPTAGATAPGARTAPAADASWTPAEPRPTTGAIPTRRELRTGAIPVVPPATGPGAAGSPASSPTAAPGPGGFAASAAGPTGPGDGAGAPDPSVERRSTWTHPNLVGRDAAGTGAAGVGAPVPGPASPVPATPTTGVLPAAAAAWAQTAPEDTAGADGDDPDEQEPRGRRRWPLVAGIVAAVLVLGGGGAWYLLGRDEPGTVAAPPDVVLPSPTATVEPVARTATTAFASALPATLLQYALATSADDADWLAHGALEAYGETYTDGAAGQVAVQAGQWETPEEADAVLATLVASLPVAADAPVATDAPDAPAAGDEEPTGSASGAATSGGPQMLLTGEVLVDGAATGTVTVVDAGDGSGVAVWRNGTTVFRAVGPAADIRNVYAAYPL